MKFRICINLFSTLLILFFTSIGGKTYAQLCSERIGVPHETDFVKKYDWECVDAIGTEEINGTLYAKVPIPKHNGERAFNYKDWAVCDIGYADYNNGGYRGGGQGLALSGLEDPTKGYHLDSCGGFSTVEGCLYDSSRFIGTLKPEFLPQNPGCPGAEIEPYTPPTLALEITGINETNYLDDNFYSVSYRGNVAAGRYDIDRIEWELGDGTTEILTGRDVYQRNGIFYDDSTFHRYDKPILSTTVSLTVSDASGITESQSIPVYFTDPELPIAGFKAEMLGRRLKLENLSEHPKKQSMTYEWLFGDGGSSTAESPEYVYEEAGTYTVQLTVTDVDGDIDMASEPVTAKNGLFIGVKPDDPIMDVDARQNVEVEVVNYESDDIDNFRLETVADSNFVSFIGSPSPSVLKFIPKNGSIRTQYSIQSSQSGDTEIGFNAKGQLSSGETIDVLQTEPIYIQPDLDIELSTSATSETRAGEQVTITLTITNNDNETITGIRTDALMVNPNRLLSLVSGPRDPSGIDPRVSALILSAGQSTTVTWVYTAEERGVTELRAFLTADRIRGNGRVAQDDSTVLAIESAALEISNLRLQAARLTPGTFDFIRGTLTNVGGVDVTNINFELSSDIPRIEAIESLLNGLSSGVSPRIPLLKPGKENSREFIIPIGTLTDIGSRTRFVLPLTFKGTAKIDGEDVNVISSSEIRGNIDRDKYWIDILPEVKSLLLQGFISIIDDIDEWGDSSTLGGISTGSLEGALSAFQKMGDGQLAIIDILGEASGDGGEALSQQGLQIYNTIVEYNNTTSRKQMFNDLKDAGYNVTVGGVGIFANWMWDVEKAGRDGNTREVARLLSAPTTEFVAGAGVEAGAASLFSKILKSGPIRKLLKGREKKAKAPSESASNIEREDYYRGQDTDWQEVPEGVPLTGQSALLAGVEGDELAWMTDIAKKHNVSFFVRPRPAEAAKWARAGFNAKPLQVKLKSVNDLDAKWLGYDDADKGLVVLKEPEDPYPALKRAIDRGEFNGDEREIFDVVERYHAKKAEWETRDEFLNKLNSGDVPIKDPTTGEVIGTEKGITIWRYGKQINTTVSVDSVTGRLIFDYNGKPVYSDIDLLSLAKRDGSNLNPDLHRKILKESGYGFDGQHHATAQTSDMPNDRVARDLAQQYLSEHMRDGGGGGLLIVGPDATTKGFVNSFRINTSPITGPAPNGYGLYGRIVEYVTYTGAQSR